MPRPNPARDVLAEEHLALRIRLECQRRDMSYAGLAKRMTDAGCPINQSALYKIEQGQPRRRITVDELVALAKVFETSVEDLLTDPMLVAARTVVPLIVEWQQLQRRQDDVRDRIRALAAESPEIAQAVQNYWQARAEETMAARLSAGQLVQSDDGGLDMPDLREGVRLTPERLAEMWGSGWARAFLPPQKDGDD